MAKKFFIFLLTLSLVVSLPAYASAAAIETSASNTTEKSLSLTEEDVFKALAYTYTDNKLMRAIEGQESILDGKAFHAADYAEYTNNTYGGMYVDENGTLVLCYLENSDVLKAMSAKAEKIGGLKNVSGNTIVSSMTVKEVENSYQDLLVAKEQMREFVRNYSNIFKVSINTQTNKVRVEITDDGNAEETMNAVFARFSKEIIEVAVTQRKPDDVKTKATINCFSPINNGTNSATAAGKMLTSDGFKVVSCAHDGFTTGRTVYKNPGTSTRIGRIIDHALTSYVDASIIEMDDGSDYEALGGSAYLDEISTYVPVDGSTVVLRGAATGANRVAEVVSNSTDIYQSDFGWIYDHIEVDEAVNPGDSGGGARCGSIDAGRTSRIVGIIRSGDHIGTFLCKGSYIYDALDF